MCDAKWTVEALGNIVDNAIKYTSCGENVQIKAEQYSFFVKIDIIDDGIGIEKEEIPKIFGRFYRSLSVADQPGVGIGLFLAREIIQFHRKNNIFPYIQHRNQVILLKYETNIPTSENGKLFICHMA